MIDQFVRHRLGELPGDAAGFEDGRVPDADVPLFAPHRARGGAAAGHASTRMLAEALPADWPLARLDPVLRALLRAGGAELCDARTARRRKVVINEYLDVAHGFFDGDEPRMANGVLDRLAHLLRPAEFEAGREHDGWPQPARRIRADRPAFPPARRAGRAGPADDAAVLTPPPGRELVITADAMVAGVHFLPDDPPDLIGAQAAAGQPVRPRRHGGRRRSAT